MKFDIVTWVKDGEWCLCETLRRLDKVLPSEFVGQKIAVDDKSKDNSVKLLKDFGFTVYSNPRFGISPAANFALSKVNAPFFMSFEQDLLLSKDWFETVSKWLIYSKVAAVSGTRFSNLKTVGDLERYVYRKYLKEEKLSPYLTNRKESAFTLGKTLDNTMFRTQAVKAVGGFPYMDSSSGVDTTLANWFRNAGFRWVVCPDVESIHLRKSTYQVLKHQLWYAQAMKESKKYLPDRSYIGVRHSLLRLGMSPFTGAFVACKMRNPKICVVHPLFRLFNLMGYFK